LRSIGPYFPSVGSNLLIVLALILFLILCLYQIELPGLHYDEAKEAGVPAMQLLTGQPVETFRGSGVRIGERVFPIMVTDYIGALNVYLLLPSLSLFGITVPALRLVPVLCSALTLLLTCRLAQRLFGRRVAVLTGMLLAVNPSFVFWSRQGVFVTSLAVTIAMAGLLCWLRWHREQRPRYLYGAAFLFGMGLYAKLLFLWLIVALAATFVVFQIPVLRKGIRLRPRIHQWPYKHWIVAFLFFLLGTLPLVVYNIQTEGTLRTLTENLTSTYYGGSNLAIAENLVTRLEQFKVVLNGGHLWYLGGIFANDLYPIVFAGSGLFGLLFVVLKARHRWRRVAFPYLMLAIMLLTSVFTVSALWFTHYVILVPFLPLAVVVPLDLVIPDTRRVDSDPRQARVGRFRKLIPTLVLIAVVGLVGAADLQVDLRYHQALARSGGYAAHSDASYKLAQSLLARGTRSPLAMDWGIDATVEFLTAGAVNPIEIFGYEWEAGAAFAERLSHFLPEPRNLYIFHSEEETVFQRRQAFDALVVEAGLTSHVEQEIHDRSGRLMFVLVKVE
jgi:4-amino-4-deoxy-L-arabinose transferase-like glycosyltransferase